jgi:hypothetical protein
MSTPFYSYFKLFLGNKKEGISAPLIYLHDASNIIMLMVNIETTTNKLKTSIDIAAPLRWWIRVFRYL